MMKCYFTSVVFLFCSTISFGQSNFDNIWILAHSVDGSSIIDFGTEPPEISELDIEMFHFSANASICDSLGNLLFYTNGTFIADSSHQQMENGMIDCGELSGSFPLGVNTPQIVMILPQPGHPERYFLFNKALHGDFEPDWTSKFYYSIIDMNENGGLGGIVEKDHLVLEDVYLGWGKITACRHANGRDWWIMLGEGNTNRFFTYLLTPEGLIEGEVQTLGTDVPSGLGQAAFSPDGSKYATLNLIDIETGNYIDIYDFDRCEGYLDNHIQIAYADSAWSGGIAFSPNSRFLYVSSYNFVYQYDLWESDIEGSREIIAEYDGFTSPFPTRFFLSQLAPDNRIYINCPNGVNVLHVINSPDEKGEECDLVQHGIELPADNPFSIPNYPYFNLGALEGSPCDTLGVTAVKEVLSKTVGLFPNPTTGHVNIDVPLSSTIYFYDSSGQLKLSRQLDVGFNFVQFETISPGIYFYEVRSGEIVLGSGKLLVE